MHNIVQAELFRVNEDNLFGLLKECNARVKDGGEIKTHLRFYDHTGVFTKFIREAERLAEKRKRLLDAFWESRGLTRWWLNRRLKALAGRSLKIPPQAAYLTYVQLRTLSAAKGPIALEVARGSKLRAVRSDELHELVEAAGRVQKAWLVLYAPGELLSYEPRMLGSTITC